MLTNIDDEKNMKLAAEFGVSLYFVKANTKLEILKTWVAKAFEK